MESTHYSYLLVNVLCILFPLAFSFVKPFCFFRKFRAAFGAIFLVATFFVIWDIYFTKLGIWSFNENYLTGIYLVNLPIEEVLFFICIPFACLFTFYCVTLYLKFNPFNDIKLTLIKLISILIAVIGVLNIKYDYTASSLILMAVFLFWTAYSKWKHLPTFLFTYLIILFPFLVSNGILTGSFIDEPIVKYNNNENLGIRVLTIPIEDLFYSGILQISNIFLFTRFNTKT